MSFEKLPDVDTKKSNEDDNDSISQTYSRLSKRSTILERLRGKRKSSPSPAPMSNSNSSTGSIASSILPPLAPVSLLGYKKSTKHKLLDKELAGNIRNLIPARHQLFDDWHLVYSLEQHGISLRTLYQNSNPAHQREVKRKIKEEKGFADGVVSSMVVTSSGTSNLSNFSHERHHGYVLVIKDETNAKFGCFLNEHLRPMEHKRYYGNGECFLWKVEMYDPRKLTHSSSQGREGHPVHGDAVEEKQKQENKEGDTATRFKAFMYTGINDNIIYSDNGFIAIGSSNGKNGLWIDKSLYRGVSCTCDTFGNEILNGNPEGTTGRFKIMGLELWRIGDYD
ncbi:oxidation resistance protein 1 [[Candida] railenensis]|uniref:Oxidation resistance protein 1 n=1 Tax=[Candida] railenensis TaxID=45579 RepID=A0A9P0QRE6_9ASCO|nr:oxidation resistance protein 1 [[Candida] railenensis]